MAFCSESLVGTAGRSERAGDDVEVLIYQKAKGKVRPCVVVCEQIGSRGREAIGNRGTRNLVINVDN